MKDRRHSERIKCRFRCEIAVAGAKPFGGTVVDVSSGGLAVRAESDVQQGDPLAIRIEVPGRGPIAVEAIAWHVRHARRRDTGETVHLLGLMLSKAPDEYFKLARGTRPARTGSAAKTAAPGPPPTKAGPAPTPRPAARSAAAPACSSPPPQPLPAAAARPPAVSDLTPFRIRLKHRSSPRTRVISVDAASSDEAREIAGAELGAEWEILESPNLMRS